MLTKVAQEEEEVEESVSFWKICVFYPVFLGKLRVANVRLWSSLPFGPQPQIFSDETAAPRPFTVTETKTWQSGP